ncbi:Multidrug resistance protein B [Roseomonas mucosa]|uniref:MDR family MFS transporter n=1 Tax=Roseomonas mucosa TaxID=207340 RepID=UPI0024CADBC2|nr:MDR family MFS transporter [Roseomonas mucosa]QDD94369.1 Multidrug resistance protein B [Roseomonas mucosa]
MPTSSPHPARRPLVMACIMVSMFMVAIESTIIATAMPRIVRQLGDFSLYSWVFSAFLMAQSATTVIYGRLADIHGRRPVLFAGIAVFLAGSLLCGLAWSMPSLILFRLLQGLGAGAILPVGTTVVGDLYPPEERARVQGLLASVWAVSAVIGPMAGAVLVERVSWSWVFWINIPIGLLTVAGLAYALRETVERRTASVDYPGALIFAGCVGALLMLLTLAGGDASWRGPGMLVAGLALLAGVPLLLWQESRVAAPMIALDLWRERIIQSANGATLLAGMGLIGLSALLPVYVQGVVGASPLASGFTLTAMSLGWPLAASQTGRINRHLGMRNTTRLGTGLFVLGTVPLLFLDADSLLPLAALASFLVGLGMGLFTTTCVLLVQGSTGWSRRGAATASNVFSRLLGSTLGVALLGGILNLGAQSALRATGSADSTGKIRNILGEGGMAGPVEPALRAALLHGLHWAFWAVFALAVLSFLLTLRIPHPAAQPHLGDSARPQES